MTAWRRAMIAATVVGACGSLSSQTPAAPAQSQTFRARADVVFVDVSVRDGSRAVTGLGAEDFVLTDNGVRQRIESVEAAAVPIDLTLVVDLSGNPRRPWMERTPVSRIAARLDNEIIEVARLLRADDRLRVLAIDDRVSEIVPFGAVPVPPVRRVDFGGLASVYDALAIALLHPVLPARRHVVIARTKGVDTTSAITAETVRAVAERSDALLHLVMMETARDTDVAYSAFQCNPMMIGLCWPTRRSSVPHVRSLFRGRPTHSLLPDGMMLAKAADATGGRLHQTGALIEPTLTRTFQRAFDDFRSGYMLRYVPQGVAPGGWHAIEVRAARRVPYRIQARTGYGVDESASSPPPPPPTPPAGLPRTLEDLIAAYSGGHYQRVVTGLRALPDPERALREFAEGGNPWPAMPRREAAFALELAEPGLFSTQPAGREAALRMIARFGRLVRHPLEADVFERYWHFAALTVLQGALRPEAASPLVAQALARFPDELQFVLARAIVNDQRTAVGVARSAAEMKETAARYEDVRQQYLAAAAWPQAAVEARIRLGWLLHRLGRHDEARQQLIAAAAGAIQDPSLRYLQQLLIGHVLAALDRPDDAQAAFRGALAVMPAQSARVALMNTLLLQGDRSAAEALAEQIQGADPTTLDPWTMYWQGQYRLYPAAMARLRELVR
jgi:tetratricopeptide (TPR) repeat protein